MYITFWGTRGSCPGAFSHKSKFGGNTTCISLQTKRKSSRRLIVDSGTGIRECAKTLDPKSSIYLILSHDRIRPRIIP